ncbi:MAG: acyl-CoA/acyl-ACP dehydrogenase [Planctomycetales bacterium]|nr:acyl-CoA/acyl-ACP dehydrogenase [Planctomycetales bacterium]
MSLPAITHCDAPEMALLTAALRKGAGELREDAASWPFEQLRQCAEAGVFEWFLDPRWGGRGWSNRDIMTGYLELSAACLTTTFIITQYMGACRRIATSGNDALAEELLPGLLNGSSFATVGISHLTTSRRHLKQPVLRATETEAGFVLDGYSPWCTGATQAEHVVLGATMEDGRELLLAAPMSLPGIEAQAPASLMALSASQTGAVRCDGVEVPRRYLLAGPMENVMHQGVGASPGGLQTSVLAAGLARAACRYMLAESEQRSELCTPAASLSRETERLCSDLLDASEPGADADQQRLRQRANSLVTRSTQAALGAAKGAGYIAGHPVGRWCREALFFLVWSCPQPVLSAHLCELAGVESLGD